MNFSDTAARLVTGCRILAEQQILDAFGHLSARFPDDPTHFVISRGMSPALVEVDDFLLLDLDGKVVAGDGYPNAEWPIHAAIYHSRPDVHAVLHSHSHLSQIFSLSHHKLRGLLITSAPEWQDGLPVYRSAGLITSLERGHLVAEVLGTGSALLLRGHGDVVATSAITTTVLKAITLKQNADVLNELIAHGGEVKLWDGDELAAWKSPTQTLSPEAQKAMGNRAWDYYEARISGRLARLLGANDAKPT